MKAKAADAGQVSQQTITGIRQILEEAERMKNAYFFSPPQSAGERRNYEKFHSCPEITWTESGHIFTASFSVSCSCRNVYAAGDYTKDGKKTTLTAIRNSYKRLTAEA